MDKTLSVKIVAWALSVGMSVVAVVAWGQSLDWDFVGISVYQIFPVLGLLAFSIMLSHYMSGMVRHYAGLPSGTLKGYYRATSAFVLVCLLLHPGLLILQRYLDGFGLPPLSYWSYVMPSLQIFLLFGMISLLIFLAFEFKRVFGDRPWWPIVDHLNNLAMVLIYFHALNLGGQLQQGWFRTVWIAYGFILAYCLLYKYFLLLRPLAKKLS